ncbi:MAG: EAL domain-containing protein [Actinomycetota bacterium]
MEQPGGGSVRPGVGSGGWYRYVVNWMTSIVTRLADASLDEFDDTLRAVFEEIGRGFDVVALGEATTHGAGVVWWNEDQADEAEIDAIGVRMRALGDVSGATTMPLPSGRTVLAAPGQSAGWSRFTALTLVEGRVPSADEILALEVLSTVVGTARQRIIAERELRDRARRQEFLNDLSEQAAIEEPTTDTLLSMLEQARERLGVTAVSSLVRERDEFVLVASTDFDGHAAFPAGTRSGAGMATLIEAAHADYIVRPLREFGSSVEAVEEMQGDVLVVPRTLGGGVASVVVFTQAKEHAWAEAEIEFARSVARSIQKLTLRTDIERQFRRRHELDTLVSAVATIAARSSIEDLEWVIEETQRLAIECFGIHGCGIWSFDGDLAVRLTARRFDGTVAHDPITTPMSAADRSRLVERGHANIALREAELSGPAVNPDTQGLMVPIGVEPNGMIVFTSEGKNWTDDEIHAAKTLASLAEQTRERIRAEALVLERLAAEALTSSVAAKAVDASIENVDARLDEILSDVRDHFGVSQVSVWRIEGDRAFRRAAVRSDGLVPEIGAAIAAPNLDDLSVKGAMFVRQGDVDIEGHPRFDPDDTKLVVVPYGGATEIMGALVLADPFGRRWSDEAIATLASVGSVIGQLRLRMDYARRLERQQEVERVLADASRRFVNATLYDARSIVLAAFERFREEFDLAGITLLELDPETMQIVAPCEVTDDGLPLLASELPIARDTPAIARLLDPSAPLVWALDDLLPGAGNGHRSMVMSSVRGRDLLLVVVSVRAGRNFGPDVEASFRSIVGSLAQLRRRLLMERISRRRAEADQLVGEIARDFVEQPAHDHGRAVDDALARVGAFCGMVAVGQWQFEDDGSGRRVQGWQSSDHPTPDEVRTSSLEVDHPLAKALSAIERAGVVELSHDVRAPNSAEGTAILQKFFRGGERRGGLIGLVPRPRHLVPDLEIFVDLLDSVSQLIEQLWRRADADDAVGRRLEREDLLRQFATRLVNADAEATDAPREAFRDLLQIVGIDQATIWNFQPNGEVFDCSAVFHVADGDVGPLDDRFLSFQLPRSFTDPAIAPHFSSPATEWAFADAPEGMRQMLIETVPPGARRIAFLPAPGSRHDDEASYLALSRPGATPFDDVDLEYLRSAHSILVQHEARVAAERYFGVAFNSAPIGITLRDGEMRLIHCNAAYCDLVGRSVEDLVDTDLHEVMPRDMADDLTAELSDRSYAGMKISEASYRRPDGTIRWALLRTTPVEIPGRGVPLLLSYSEDITERRRTREMLEYQATHDELTGLPNRRALVGEIASELERGDGDCAVLVLDLDRFKVVNDSLGHSVGDQLLITCADRIRLSLRPGDSVCRLGGDEFAILLRAPADAHAAGVVADRLLTLLREPVTVGDDEVYPSASIGIATPQPGDAVEDLLRHADAAMYQAKGQGRDRWDAFDSSMRQAVVDRIRNETDLRRAIDNGQLEVHYQPEFLLETGEIVGTEALVRWRHPERGLLAAGSFISLAEETGLVVDLGRWVLTQATRQGAAWLGEGYDVVTRVNLSARQLRGAVVEEVEAALADASLPPDRLCLELTETAIMDDVQESARILAQFRELGVQVAIDDFGTGFSSLAYLKRFPVDILKIDRTFVDGVGVDPDDTAIVRSVIGLARTLRLEVVAEGIEDASQVGELVRLGCGRGQGFHLARPAPADDVSMLLSGSGVPRGE